MFEKTITWEEEVTEAKVEDTIIETGMEIS